MEKEKSIKSQQQKRLRRIRDVEGKLPNEIVEEIFLRLSVKSLLRFKSLSKQWKSTIETRDFAEKNLKLLITRRQNDEKGYDHHQELLIYSKEKKNSHYGFRKMCLDSPNKTIDLLNLSHDVRCCEASDCCHGLICIFEADEPFIYVVNPITHWFQQLPPARLQVLLDNTNENHTWQTLEDIKPNPRLAFVKTELHGYKLVWLYNSNRYNSDELSPNIGITKCEVFDFKSKTWRYLDSTPNYPIFDDQRPAFVNESLYWLTERDNNGETKVIVLDLCTETFRLMSNTPIINSHPDHIDMCSLDDRLCISKRKRGTMKQVVWIYESYTWKKIYSIDLLTCTSWLDHGIGFSLIRRNVFRPATPVGICKDKKILLWHRYAYSLVKYDPETKSSVIFDENICSRNVASYFPTLMSHL